MLSRVCGKPLLDEPLSRARREQWLACSTSGSTSSSMPRPLTADDGSAPAEIALHILACREAFHTAHPTSDRNVVPRISDLRRANPQSILSMIARARENARGDPGKPGCRRLE